MKCKAYGCCVYSDHGSGYCYKHLYMIKANKITRRLGGQICNKKGCKDKARPGRLYCALHDWGV